MTEQDVEIILQRAREKYPDQHPRIISERPAVHRPGLQGVHPHQRPEDLSPYYPQSNGKIERWHQSLKRECIRPFCPLSLKEAQVIVEKFVEHYNTGRLHSAIGYVSPDDKLHGREKEIFAARDRKLQQAREQRAEKRRLAHKGSPGQMTTGPVPAAGREVRKCCLNQNRNSPIRAEPGHNQASPKIN